MENVIDFLDRFFEAEVAAIAANRVPDLDDYNRKLEAMNRFASPKVKNKFGMIPLKTLEEPDYYERAAKRKPPTKRFLFRIDHYQTSDGTALYHCFVSDRSPKDWKEYGKCLIVEEVDSELTITASRFFKLFGANTYKWTTVATDSAYDVNHPGKLVETRRLLAPSDHPASMQRYER